MRGTKKQMKYIFFISTGLTHTPKLRMTYTLMGRNQVERHACSPGSCGFGGDRISTRSTPQSEHCANPCRYSAFRKQRLLRTRITWTWFARALKPKQAMPQPWRTFHLATRERQAGAPVP